MAGQRGVVVNGNTGTGQVDVPTAGEDRRLVDVNRAGCGPGNIPTIRSDEVI